MNRHEPTATDVSRAAVDVDMEALGAEKTNVELLEMIEDELEAAVMIRAYVSGVHAMQAMGDVFAALGGAAMVCRDGTWGST